MKSISAAGLALGCLALGILLGKGPMSSGSGGIAQADDSAAATRSAKTGRAAPASLHPGIATIRKASPGELAGLTEQAATMSDPVEIQRLLSECLLHMTPENWRDVIATFNKISTESGRDPADAWKLSLFRSGQVAGPEAMDSFLEKDFEKASTSCWQTLYGWASKDPHAALDWLKKAEADGHTSAPGHYGAIISGTALSDPQAALKLLEEIPAAMRKNCAGNLVWNVVQNGGTGALDSVLKYASTLDAADADNKKFANELFAEATEKLLWQADHARDVQQGCDVVLKLAQYGRDPNELTQAMIRKYRWYGMAEKLQILETVRSGIQGGELELPSLTASVMSTMGGEGDQTAVREWMAKHPDSPLIPHLKSRLSDSP